uniref:FADD n=1 Tax=Leptobrachium leishanense TaxID=445787 RepID=A0A8C5PZK4_9ANUR
MAGSASDRFLAMLVKISNELKEEDLKSLKSLCGESICNRKLEGIKLGTDLFTCLKEQNEISCENVDRLIYLLVTIERNDLAEEVKCYQRNYQTHSMKPDLQPNMQDNRQFDGTTIAQHDTQQESQLVDALDIVCEYLGSGNWKRLMRRLGVSDVTIDRVVVANPQNLYEQQMQCFREWRQQKGGDATVQVLRETLRECSMNLIHDILVEKINLK